MFDCDNPWKLRMISVVGSDWQFHATNWTIGVSMKQPRINARGVKLMTTGSKRLNQFPIPKLFDANGALSLRVRGFILLEGNDRRQGSHGKPSNVGFGCEIKKCLMPRYSSSSCIRNHKTNVSCFWKRSVCSSSRLNVSSNSSAFFFILVIIK